MYKTLGKDPARFRPSSDSLWRRVVKGQELYQVNSLVDLNNYLSLSYHLPFGSYDVDKLRGELRLTIGGSGQTYHGIGKQAIDLSNLLILSDDEGPFGSPTSDSIRAMINDDTSHAIIVGYGFSQSVDQQQAIQKKTAHTTRNYLLDTKIENQWISNHE
nr:phenylalanine--tRNA ligase beta subunit-related protein [Lentilactobacillus kosonis]